MVKGVWESTKGEWSGDVDLNNGQLEYKEEGIGLKERGSADSTRRDLQVALARLEVDLKFIHSGKHTSTCNINVIIQKHSIITTHKLLQLLKAQSNYKAEG